MFPKAVEVSIEEADPLLHVVFVLCHHPVPHNLLPRQTLQLVATETLHTDRPDDQVLRVGFEVTYRQHVGDVRPVIAVCVFWLTPKKHHCTILYFHIYLVTKSRF